MLEVKAKELIYTALFVCLGIILILLLIFMFAPEEKSTKTSAGVYTPGVYTSTIALGDNTLDVAVSLHSILRDPASRMAQRLVRLRFHREEICECRVMQVQQSG